MNQKIKTYNRVWPSLCLATVLLTGLFLAVAAVFQPLPVAAQMLATTSLISNRPALLTAVALPPELFIQASGIATYYLPLVFKNPQPSFLDTFSDNKSGWPKGSDNSCSSAYDGGRYRLNVSKDKSCFRFAPKKAEMVFGTFEVSVYHSEGQSEDALLGLYFNGDGGDKQYIFSIRPNVSTKTCANGGQWELRRRWVKGKNEKRDDLIQRACEAAIKRGYGSDNTNTIRAKHTDTGQIILFINDKQVLLFHESSDAAPELKGKGMGVYVKAPSNKDISVKFDDFKVYPLAMSP
ncbi:MAG: hypothetical protein U0401_30675 [Anaerolineae bacterium]